MNVRILLSFLFLFFLSSVHGQKSLTIYATYEDYANNTGEIIEGDFYYATTEANFGKRLYIFKNRDKTSTKENKKIKLDAKKSWGFKLNDVLFRIFDSGTQWVAIQGELIYYENGKLKLFNLRKGKNVTTWMDEYGYQCGISKDLNSGFFNIPPGWNIDKRDMKNFRKFIDHHPEYEPFYECIKAKKTYLKDIRKCAERFTDMKVPK